LQRLRGHRGAGARSTARTGRRRQAGPGLRPPGPLPRRRAITRTASIPGRGTSAGGIRADRSEGAALAGPADARDGPGATAPAGNDNTLGVQRIPGSAANPGADGTTEAPATREWRHPGVPAPGAAVPRNAGNPGAAAAGQRRLPANAARTPGPGCSRNPSRVAQLVVCPRSGPAGCAGTTRAVRAARGCDGAAPRVCGTGEWAVEGSPRQAGTSGKRRRP
jgi:hypothetical protein